MTTGPRFPTIRVKLTGTDGNAFAIIGKVSGALKRGGHADAASEFCKAAMSGDYDNVLQTACAYVDVR